MINNYKLGNCRSKKKQLLCQPSDQSTDYVFTPTSKSFI